MQTKFIPSCSFTSREVDQSFPNPTARTRIASSASSPAEVDVEAIMQSEYVTSFGIERTHAHNGKSS